MAFSVSWLSPSLFGKQFLLLILSMAHSEGDTSILGGLMIGGPLLAYAVVRAMFWIIEGFKGSPLE